MQTAATFPTDEDTEIDADLLRVPVGPGSLHVVDLATSSVVKTVPLGLYPDSVGILRRKP